jgi:hypothetical protein
LQEEHEKYKERLMERRRAAENEEKRRQKQEDKNADIDQMSAP